MRRDRLNELLLQALEHERGGVRVYETALHATRNDGLKEEWVKHLDHTRNHARILTDLCNAMELDPDEDNPGREVVRAIDTALVEAMQIARQRGTPEVAELVAVECVTLAETKDHLNWELIAKCMPYIGGGQGQMLREACEEVEEQEDRHLFRSRGWCRELWTRALGLNAGLLPPEETRDDSTPVAWSWRSD